MSKQRIEPVKVNKGVRRHNKSNGRGTIQQDMAHSDPKWNDMGNGILMSRGKGQNYIALTVNGWKSVCKAEPIVQVASV